MSELKTFRCNMCKEIYHSDENHTSITMRAYANEKETEPAKVFEHICPACTCSVVNFFSDPSQMDKLIIEKREAENNAFALEKTIKSIKDVICGYTHWLSFSNMDNVVDYCNEMREDIETQYKKTKKAHDIWLTLACLEASHVLAMAILMFAR